MQHYLFLHLPGCSFWVQYQFSRSVVSESLRPHGLQQARHPCPSPNPSLLKLMPIVSDHLILCCLLFRPPSTFTCIRVFSNELVLHIRWPNIGVSASASVLPMNIQDFFLLGFTWLDLLAVQETLKSIIQHQSSKASILWCSAFSRIHT